MKLEQLYNGRQFPAYLYDAYALTVEVRPRDQAAGRCSEFLCLPASERQIERTLLRAGIASPDEAEVCIQTNMLSKAVTDAIHPEQEGIHNLDRLCRSLEALSDGNRNKLEAVLLLAKPQCVSEICRLAENIDQFDFAPNVKTEEEYGRYRIQIFARPKSDEQLDAFFDYAGYARQRMKAEGGQFVSSGYVAYHGTLPLEELMQEDPAEQYQAEQGPQMGGMG